jgi:hypothetical protein
MTERRGGSDVGQGTETVAVQQVSLRSSNMGVSDNGFSGSSTYLDPESRHRFVITNFYFYLKFEENVDQKPSYLSS